MKQIGFVDKDGRAALAGDEYEYTVDDTILRQMIRKAWKSKSGIAKDGPITIRFRKRKPSWENRHAELPVESKQRAELLRYGKHSDAAGCTDDKCYCGLDAALNAADNSR